MVVIKEIILLLILAWFGRLTGGCDIEIPESAYEELKGRRVMPGDDDYNVSIQIANERFNSTFPCVVLYCGTSEEVSTAILWSRKYKIPFAVRSGGHSYEGYSLSSGMIIDISYINQTKFSFSAKVPLDIIFYMEKEEPFAIIGGGTKQIDVYNELYKYGYVLPGGSCPAMGVSGYTLGGGFGLLGMQFGMMVDSLIGVKTVLASGEIVEANKERYSDLLWAQQGGGGGSFGVATHFTFKLNKLPPSRNVTTYIIKYPLNTTSQIVDIWQQWIPNLDKRLSAKLTFHTFDITAIGIFLEDGPNVKEELMNILDPIIKQGLQTKITIITQDWLETSEMLGGCKNVEECEHPGRAAWKGKSGFVKTSFPPEAFSIIQAWMEKRAQNKTYSYAGLMLDAMGGKIQEVKEYETAFPHRNSQMMLQFLVYWDIKKEDQKGAEEWVDGFYSDLQPYLEKRSFRNYIDNDVKDWGRQYFAGNFERLVEIKKRYDPDNVFNFSKSIPLHI